MKVVVFIAAVLLLSASASAVTFQECATSNGLTTFTTFFGKTPGALDALNQLTGTLFAFDNNVKPEETTNGFSASQIISNVRYMVGTPTTDLAGFLALPSFTSQLNSPTLVNLGGANQNLVVTNYNSQAFVNGYSAISNTDVIKCDDNHFLFKVSSYIYLPDVTIQLLQNNQDQYKVTSFVNAMKSTGVSQSANNAKTTTLALTDSAMSAAGSLSSGQLSNLVFNEIIFTKNVPTTGVTKTAINGNQVTFKRTGDLLTITSGSQTAKVVSFYFDLPTRNGVTHVIDTAFTANSAPAAGAPLGLVSLLVALLAAFALF